jgi:hypothetical protein
MQMAKGTIERKCLKGHRKAEGRCSSRCLRWYSRIERRVAEGRRKFDYLGGYRTRTAARAALDAALLQRRERTTADPPPDPLAGPAGPTLDELLDRWLAHLHNTGAIRLRTTGRYRHADGGALAGRTYIHQVPQTPPRIARLIEDLYGPATRRARRGTKTK